MRIVFDFGGVVFRWHPASFLARVWPHRIETLEQGAAATAVFFQNYGGDWGLFDQGLISADEVVRRIAARTGAVNSRWAGPRDAPGAGCTAFSCPE